MRNEASEEAQALLVLRRWQEMPGLGIQLVPEHVETRPLYHPRSPGLLQVKGPTPQDSSPDSGTFSQALYPHSTQLLTLAPGVSENLSWAVHPISNSGPTGSPALSQQGSGLHPHSLRLGPQDHILLLTSVFSS